MIDRTMDNGPALVQQSIVHCELMLCFDERRIAVPDEPPVELGMATGLAGNTLRALRGKSPSLEQVEVGGL